MLDSNPTALPQCLASVFPVSFITFINGIVIRAHMVHAPFSTYCDGASVNMGATGGVKALLVKKCLGLWYSGVWLMDWS